MSLQPAAGRPRILLAEDSTEMRGYLQTILSEYEVEAVGDGPAALAAARARRPDLILSDVMMPGIDGCGLLRELRADARTRDVPIILLSAMDAEEARVEGLEAGADDYLIKPFSRRELLARVQARLELAALRRETQQSLRDSEEHLRAVVETTPACIKVIAPDGTVLDVNSAGLALFDAARIEEIRGRSIYDLVAPEWRDAYRALHDHVCRGGRGALEYEIVGLRGTRRRMETHAAPLRTPDGSHRHLAVTHDVTGRARAAEAIAKRNRQLELLLEAARVLLGVDEPDTMLQELFAKIGYSVGLDLYFNFMATEAGDALRLASCAGISGDEAQQLSRIAFGEGVCGRVAAERRPIVASAVRESDEPMVPRMTPLGVRAYACYPLVAAGRLLGTLSFASRSRDRFEPDEVEFLQTISHYVTAAYERHRLVAELRHQDRRKDEFLATLAHELRNPLAPIRTGVHLLQRARQNADILDKACPMIDRQLQHMVRLVDDLLDVSRISRNKLELRREWVALDTIVQNAVETSRPLIEAGAHEITVALPAAPVLLDADPVRLAQAFSNLLNNASKYTERGGSIFVTAEVVDRSSGAAPEVVVRVRDTGIGIPADRLPHIFDLFVQVERSLDRSQGGLGIGLTLARRIVEMHGGSLIASSDGPGSGSEFVARLPAMAPAPATGEHVAIAGAGPDVARVRRRVLVVDDNDDSAEMLASLLGLLGHEVFIAHDGLAAIDDVRTRQPDIAFVDLGMPRVDGFEAARRIREQPWGRTVVLVAVTGWGQADDRRRSREAGFDAHLVKPADLAEIETLIAGCRSVHAP
ncbi:MAG TPA: response regulator [Vicinamibacterales bacterium]|nr:response regulator [Vicinamibacterales bacterium]